MITKVVLLLSALLGDYGVNAIWSYDGDLGPENWCFLFRNKGGAQCCGKRQSPINLISKDLLYAPSQIYFKSYNLVYKNAVLWNNGHTVLLQLNASDKPPEFTIFDGVTQNYRTYVFDSLHFHFGNYSDFGSEHQIDGHSFPMEAHIVHYNKIYGSLENAQTQHNGLSVISLLFKISEENNVNFNPIIQKLKDIAFQGSTVIIEPIKLQQLLPSNPSFHFTYEGSLTTPLCFETVTWIILAERVPISEIQMMHFRMLTKEGLSEEMFGSRHHHYSGDFYVSDNTRPLQKLNGRRVYTNIKLFRQTLTISQTLLSPFLLIYQG